MAIDVSYRDTFTTSAEDLARTNRNFIINEGVAFDGLKVTQSLTPAMTVAVATGTGYFYGSGTNANVMYEFYSDASETVTIGTAGVQARIDIICLKVDASTGVASIVAVAGTPSGSPAVPATPASHYKLAEIAVGISVTTITDANITDTRRSVFVAPTGARNQGLINGKIVPTVASNDLTVAIKTLTDTDPSATNPVGIWIGNNLRWITGAMNTTMPAGFNIFNSGSSELATKEIDYFVYIGKATTGGALSIGFARIPYAKLGSDFNTSVTNERYGRFDSANIEVNNISEVVNIGRFAATLSAATNWSVPSFTNANLIQEPIYETRWLDWTLEISGAGSMTYTSPTIFAAKYRLDYTDCNMQLQVAGTVGGTPGSNLRASLPISALNRYVINGAGIGFDGGASQLVGCGNLNTASTTVLDFYKPTGTNWTAGSAFLGACVVYPIA
jgi:hypothetical protein